MRPEDLASEIKNAAEILKQNEKFATAVLAAKASRAAKERPHDASLVTARNVLKKMAESKTFISRAELNKLYDDLYSPSSSLSRVFAEELNRNVLKPSVVMKRDEFEDQPLSRDYTKVGDPLLMNALAGAFDDNPTARLYSSADGKAAQKSCYAELLGSGLPPDSVDVFAGQGDVIVCQATYDTPKGKAHVLVPVEMSEGQALLPSLFLTRAGFADIDRNLLENHIKSTAGKNFKVDGQALLSVIAAAKNGVETVDEVDMAVMRLNAQTETPHAHQLDGITYQQLDDENPNVEIPEVEKDPEVLSFAERLSSPDGIARQVFGERVVQNGLNMVARHLKGMGFGSVQVKVASCKDEGFSVAARINHQYGISVPVNVENSLVHPPTLAFANGQVEDFSAQGISNLVASNGVGDVRMASAANPSYGMKPSELMAQVRAGIAESNFVKVEDAITALGEVDVQAQQNAIQLFLESNNPNTLAKVASEQRGCSRIVKNSTHSQPLCGHLMKPLSEVYQDKHGNCRPLYAKSMEETSEGEGGTFMTYEAFWGSK